MFELTEFWGSSFRCEEIILLRIYLQVLNDKMLKLNNEICLKCEYQIKIETIRSEKMLQLIKSAFFENWISSFETLNSTF